MSVRCGGVIGSHHETGGPVIEIRDSGACSAGDPPWKWDVTASLMCLKFIGVIESLSVTIVR